MYDDVNYFWLGVGDIINISSNDTESFDFITWIIQTDRKRLIHVKFSLGNLNEDVIIFPVRERSEYCTSDILNEGEEHFTLDLLSGGSYIWIGYSSKYGQSGTKLLLSITAVDSPDCSSRPLGHQQVCLFWSPWQLRHKESNASSWMESAILEIKRRCPGKRCTVKTSQAFCRRPGGPLGLVQDGTIPDDRITAFSGNSSSTGPDARLLGHRAWRPVPTSDQDVWLQVDLLQSATVYAIVVKDENYIDTASVFSIAYKTLPFSDFKYVLKEDGQNATFKYTKITGGLDMVNLSSWAFEAVTVRIVIVPKDGGKIPALRFELFGCYH